MGDETPPAEQTDGSINPLTALTTSRGFVRVPTYDVRQYIQSTLLTMAIGFGIGVGVGAVFGNILGDKKAPGLGRLVGNRRRRTSRRRRPRRNSGRVLKRYLIRDGGGSYFEVQAYSREGALIQARKETDYAVRIVESEPVKKNSGRRRTSARRRKRGRPTGGAITEAMAVTIDRQTVHVVVKQGSVLVDGRRYGSVYDLGTTFRAIPAGGGEVRSFGTMAGAVKHVLRQAA